MRKSLFITGCTVVVLVWSGVVFSQQRVVEQPALADIFRVLEGIEKKLDGLAVSSSGDAGTKQLLSRLDQILENQRQMAKELDVIKVRASRN